MKKVLFEITEDDLETGLRGYPCGYCPSSYVDATKGLFYVGRPIAELATKRPEEVISLLFFGKEISAEEQQIFEDRLKEHATLSQELLQAIESLPRKGHPMKLFSAAMLLLGMIEGTGDYQEDCLRLIAKVPLLAAAVINHHAGWTQVMPSSSALSYIERMIAMLGFPKKEEKKLIDVFSLFNVLHYDHGGGNLSVFVGKAVASGLEDLYGSLCAALCALAGPRHGKANQDALSLLEEIRGVGGDNITKEQIESFLQEKVAKGELLFGFGHAVLRVEDPRASVLYAYASSHYKEYPLVRIALLLRDIGSRVLSESKKVADPHPNVDAISGALLSAAGFPYPDYFPVLFGASRCVGVAVQIVYERLEAREGKGTPIVRPKYLYRPRQ